MAVLSAWAFGTAISRGAHIKGGMAELNSDRQHNRDFGHEIGN